MTQIAIVDSGANFASVSGALGRLGASYQVTSDPQTLLSADRVILPGVGDVGDTWRRLQQNALPNVLRELKQPLLGICVGMQVMFEYCEEADIAGLGLFPGAVRKLPAAAGIRIPHMGWNQMQIERRHPLSDALAGGQYAYFVHSYAATINDHTLASCEHGAKFSAVVAHDNRYGVQFHPERSASVGRDVLNAFLQL